MIFQTNTNLHKIPIENSKIIKHTPVILTGPMGPFCQRWPRPSNVSFTAWVRLWARSWPACPCSGSSARESSPSSWRRTKAPASKLVPTRSPILKEYVKETYKRGVTHRSEVGDSCIIRVCSALPHPVDQELGEIQQNGNLGHKKIC